jgi:agmatinase
MERYPVNLPYVGIASFAKLPVVEDLAAVEADVAILGVPWDAGVGYRPGARFGPRGIREYSTRFAFGERGLKPDGYWDIELGRRRLAGVRLVDCGDTDALYLDVGYTFDGISAAVRTLAGRGALVVALGGDHSVTFPVVRGLDAVGPFDVVHLDAHLDYTDEVHGVRLANSSPIRRIGELPFVGHIAQLGIRGIRAREDAYRAALERGNTVVTMAQLRERGVGEVLDALPLRHGRCYVSVDVDALDPAIAPGTGSPEFDGFSHALMREMLEGIAARWPVVAFDLVEVSPPLDPGGLTQMLAAQLVLEFAGAICEARAGSRS